MEVLQNYDMYLYLFIAPGPVTLPNTQYHFFSDQIISKKFDFFLFALWSFFGIDDVIIFLIEGKF